LQKIGEGVMRGGWVLGGGWAISFILELLVSNKSAKKLTLLADRQGLLREGGAMVWRFFDVGYLCICIS